MKLTNQEANAIKPYFNHAFFQLNANVHNIDGVDHEIIGNQFQIRFYPNSQNYYRLEVDISPLKGGDSRTLSLNDFLEKVRQG